MDLNKITNVAVEAALEAGKIIKTGFGTAFKISSKEGRNNLVTEYDHLSENLIIKIISEKFPESAFLAEESGKSGRTSSGGLRWIIDPLDGTVNFAHNIPIFSVSIAAELDGELVSGVVHHPILDETFVAEKNSGAKLNNSEIRVSSNPDLDKAALVTGFPYNISQNPCGCIENFVNIIKRGIPVRRLGSAALDFAYVAAGRFDGFWEIDLNPWDTAAGVLLVCEAGGLVTKYDKSVYSVFDNNILATNTFIHDELSEELMSCKCVNERKNI